MPTYKTESGPGPDRCHLRKLTRSQTLSITDPNSVAREATAPPPSWHVDQNAQQKS